MILAELSSRTHVDYRTVARMFAHMNFTTSNLTLYIKLNSINEIIETAEKQKNEVRIECLSNKRDQNYARINELSDELRAMKKRLLSYMLHKDVKLKATGIKNEIRRLQNMNDTIGPLIYKIKEKDNQWNRKYYTAFDVLYECKEALTELGFKLKSSHNDDNSDIERLYFQFDGDEAQLEKMVDIKLEKMKADLEKRKEAIKINYTNKLNDNILPESYGEEFVL